MPNPIPDEMHHLFDGYDGGREPSKEYLDALIASAPPEIRMRIVARQAQISENLLYIENEGALFRGPARGVPLEVWSSQEGKFIPYKLAGQPKSVDWGTIVSEEEAQRFME